MYCSNADRGVVQKEAQDARINKVDWKVCHLAWLNLRKLVNGLGSCFEVKWLGKNRTKNKIIGENTTGVHS